MYFLKATMPWMLLPMSETMILRSFSLVIRDSFRQLSRN